MPRIHTLTDIVLPLATDSYTASGSGASVNTLGYSSAALLVTATTNASGTLSVSIQESSDNATWTNVANSTLTTIPVSSTLATATASINLKVRKQYLRAVYVLAGSGGTVAATNSWLLTNPQQWPVVQALATIYV